MKRISRLIAVVGALTFVVSGALSAQGKSSTARPAQHTAVAHPSNPANPKPAEQHDSFRGIATKLGMSSGELESAYQTAKQANPKLTHGQFVAANMVAHNLGSKNPAITTPAILSGLQSGKSLGQTLTGLGLSEKEADAAERQAKRDAAAAQRAAPAENSPKPTTP